ncbi:MAG: RNA 2'-phosphotransferase, partial [Propionibacteriaceae bacterium]|nr:RNA 2'-phosphotransferase [Propionibacteriaceae bacterium]
MKMLMEWNRVDEATMVGTSKYLAWILRHQQRGIETDGTIKLSTLLEMFDIMRRCGDPFVLVAIIVNNLKKCFLADLRQRALSVEAEATMSEEAQAHFRRVPEMHLRAAHGHSASAEGVSPSLMHKGLTLQDLRTVAPLVHGTSRTNVGTIVKAGLIRMARHGQSIRAAVHFAAVGYLAEGRGAQDVLKHLGAYVILDHEAYLREGGQLWLSTNGVVLAYADVAAKYLKITYKSPY